jgi:hypothetical protein
MTNKSIRDYINLIENAQTEEVAESTLNPIHPELHKKLTAGGYTHVKDNEYTHPTHGKVKVKPSGTDSYSRTRSGLKPEGVRVHGKGIDSYKSNWTNKSSKF